MLLTVIALAGAIQSPPNKNAFAPDTTGPVIVTPENVELNGTGTFAFEPDPRAFAVDPPPGSDGVSVTVRLWFDATGKPLDCSTGTSTLVEAARTGCAQLMKSAKLRPFPGMIAPLHRGFIDVAFNFFKDVRGEFSGRKMVAHPHPGYTNIAIIYPPDQSPMDRQLGNTDGNFSLFVEPADYPSIALRYGFESQSAVLLGIGRDGSVKNCRPITSPGLRTAFLDNYTCMLFIRRGQLQFSPNAPVYDGVKYMKKSLRWMLPKN